MIPNWSDLKLAYRLFDRPEVLHSAMIQQHCRHTLERIDEPGYYLLIEDTTTLAFHGRSAHAGLGPIGEGYTRGLLAHTTLAVRVDWEKSEHHVLGMLGQQTWVRPLKSAGALAQIRRLNPTAGARHCAAHRGR